MVYIFLLFVPITVSVVIVSFFSDLFVANIRGVPYYFIVGVMEEISRSLVIYFLVHHVWKENRSLIMLSIFAAAPYALVESVTSNIANIGWYLGSIESLVFYIHRLLIHVVMIFSTLYFIRINVVLTIITMSAIHGICSSILVYSLQSDNLLLGLLYTSMILVSLVVEIQIRTKRRR